jgi:hypothetical protein
MTKKDAEMIDAIGRTVGAVAGEDIRKRFLEGSDKVAKAPAGTGAQSLSLWLKDAVARLDALVDEPTRVRIMETCGTRCAEINRRAIDGFVRRRQKYRSVDEYLAAEEKKPARGTRLERTGNLLYFHYTPNAFRPGLRCYCSLWRGLPAKASVSRTYCHCSKAFVAKLWQAILERPVKVELLQSCIAGAKECKFVVHL